MGGPGVGAEMLEMKNCHVDLRSKKPAEGGRDFGIAGAARCHGESQWKVEAECEEAGGMPLGHMVGCARECG